MSATPFRHKLAPQQPNETYSDYCNRQQAYNAANQSSGR